jgi:hypothetical protein
MNVNGCEPVRSEVGPLQLKRFMQRVRVGRRVEVVLDGREQAAKQRCRGRGAPWCEKLSDCRI